MQALRAGQASSGAVSRIARADASHSAAASCQPTQTFALKVDLPPGETLPERVGSSATGAAAGAAGEGFGGRAPPPAAGGEKEEGAPGGAQGVSPREGGGGPGRAG